MPRSVLFAILLLVMAANADEPAVEFGGHTKFSFNGQTWPDDSLMRAAFGSSSIDALASLRLNVEWRNDGWAFDAAYQLVGVNGDRVNLGNSLPPGAAAFLGSLPNDDRRLFDLTDVISQSGDSALLHRLDRLWLGYSSEKTVVRFGRQALSWGNGLLYAPMDLVNPFDPSAIDTEYKSGDDMLYAQYLADSGDDVQGAAVFRRNPLTGDVESDQATYAAKYHGFAGDYEYDLLLAENYGDPVLGLGISHGIGGAQWTADIVVADTSTNTYTQLVTNLTYSWIFADKNMSGMIEYYFNGFGQHDGQYDPASLAGNPDLLLRLTRGQTFTLGRHYIAGSVMIEMTPLWSVSPVLLANVRDPSGLLQLTTDYSLGDNLRLLGNINIPLGPSGSEFGGIESGIPGLYLSSGAGVFAQFAWYF